MVGCSAPNCANKTERGIRLFRFPSEEKRKAIWLQNCRRDKWKPTSSSRICEVHFEENQWELHRADGWKKLKPNAVPTLFNVPNPPKKLASTRRSIYKDTTTPSQLAGAATSTESETANHAVENDSSLSDKTFPAEEDEQIKQLKNEVALLKEELQKKDSLMSTFLNREQIAALEHTPNKWSAESVLLGLKLRFSLGVNGYNFIRETKYPLPSIATINRRIQNFKPNFGIFTVLSEAMNCKVDTMDELDKVCTLSIDEMEISGKMDFDKNEGKLIGRTTLGDPKAIGNHLTVVLARGVKTPWKQVIACEVTGASTKGELQAQLIQRCVNFVESCGLLVVAVTSDMGSNNRSMWRALGVHVNRENRKTTSKIGETEVEMVPDVCHLLKNLKNAVLSNRLFLPQELVEKEELPTNFITGRYIVEFLAKI